MNEYCIVLTAFANDEEAKKVIDAVLDSKLAACIQTLNINSHYIWKEKTYHEPEVLALFKTSWILYDQLEAKIKELHSYEVPEIIAIDIKEGFKEYFEWIDKITNQFIKN